MTIIVEKYYPNIGRGKCSPSCITYNCPQLSGKSDFMIDRIEVWAVGPEPEEEEETVIKIIMCRAILPFFAIAKKVKLSCLTLWNTVLRYDDVFWDDDN